MRVRLSAGNLAVGFIALLLTSSSFAKDEKMPLPQQLMTAKAIYIDNRSGFANIGDKAYDELQKWGRFRVVDSAEKADIVLLLSANEYISGYSSNSYHSTNGSVSDSGDINTQTHGYTSSSAVVSGTTYITIIDPKHGIPLWSDSRPWGLQCVFCSWKSATRSLIKDLRKRVEQQELDK